MVRGPLRLALGLALAAAAAACNTGLGLGQGRLYACERDGGWRGDGGGEPQCPGDFHCGLEGYCHARDAGAAWRCEADFDCDPGWRCGLRGDGGLGACQDRAVGGPYPCVPADDSACEQLWRCGLSGQCHDPDAGAALPCLEGEDRWCDRGWRCGPELVCVDPSREALLPTPERDAGAERISPRFSQGATGVSVRAAATTFSAGWVRGTQVLAAGWADTAAPRWTPPAVALLDAGAGALVQAFATGAFVADGRRVRRVSFALDAGATVALPEELLDSPAFAPTGLRSVEPQPGPNARLLVAFDAQHVALWAGDAGVVPVAAPSGGLRDLQLVDDLLLAATPQGLMWTDGRNPAAWSSLTLTGTPPPPPPAPLAAPMPIQALRSQERPAGRLVTFLGDGPDGGPPLVWALPVTVLAGPPELHGLAPPTRCEACPGAQPVGLLETDDAAGGRVRVRCQRGQQTFLAEHHLMGSALLCATALTPAPPAVDEPGGPAMVDDAGETSFSRGDDVEMVTLGAPPWAVLDTDAGTVCLAQHGEYGGGLYLLDPALGFAALRFAPPAAISLAAPVEGTADLAAVLTPTDLRLVSPTAQWALVPVSADLLGGPLHATSRRDDGGTSFYVSDFDTLLSGRLADGAAAGTLQTRAVPLPRQAIQSLVAQPPTSRGDGGVYQHLGYVVAQGRVFRFLAFTEQVWRTDELLMPGEAVAVWTDADRARVGLRDGTVLSLPTRISLGAALPGGEQVLQYAHVCGETFALGAAGLHRLVLRADGGVIGAWVDEPRLDAVLVPRPASTAGVTLLTTPTDLLVSTADHAVVRLRLDCR